MYTHEKVDIALKLYHRCGSVTKTVRTLWYPTKRIHDECKQENLVVKIRKKRKYSSCREEISPAVSNVI